MRTPRTGRRMLTLVTARRSARAVVLAVTAGASRWRRRCPPLPPSLDGAPVETQNQFCSPTGSARTNLTVISTGAQPQVGQDFHLLVTVVGLNLLLPTGDEVSPTGQSACVTFASSNPGRCLGWVVTRCRCSSPCGRPQRGNGPHSRGCATAARRCSAWAPRRPTRSRAWRSPSLPRPPRPAPSATITADKLLIAKNRFVCSGSFPAAYSGRRPTSTSRSTPTWPRRPRRGTRSRRHRSRCPKPVCEQVYATDGYGVSVQNPRTDLAGHRHCLPA